MQNDTKTKFDETAFLRDMSKPSLHALSYALRHPDTWPEGFVWDFRQCTSCAIGLAHQLWNTIKLPPNNETKHGSTLMARTFAMPYTEARNIFFGDLTWSPIKTKAKGFWWWKTITHYTDLKNVTPDMVADQIDKYIAERAE